MSKADDTRALRSEMARARRDLRGWREIRALALWYAQTDLAELSRAALATGNREIGEIGASVGRATLALAEMRRERDEARSALLAAVRRAEMAEAEREKVGVRVRDLEVDLRRVREDHAGFPREDQNLLCRELASLECYLDDDDTHARHAARALAALRARVRELEGDMSDETKIGTLAGLPDGIPRAIADELADLYGGGAEVSVLHVVSARDTGSDRVTSIVMAQGPLSDIAIALGRRLGRVLYGADDVTRAALSIGIGTLNALYAPDDAEAADDAPEQED